MKSQGETILSGVAYINFDYYIYKGDEYIIYQILHRNNNGVIQFINEGVEKIEKINVGL